MNVKIVRMLMILVSSVSISYAASQQSPSDATTLTQEAKKLLASWLEAQNSGNFKAYEKLYSQKFTGVKRSGSRTRKYNYKGWLRDRELMFRRSMDVSIEKVEVTPSTESVLILFEQTWSSGKFHDKGPKRMVLHRESDGLLKISTEEMLSSDLVPQDSAPQREIAKCWG